MKNKIISLIFLIVIIGNIYAYSLNSYETSTSGNMMGYITDHGANRYSVYDLRETEPAGDWYNVNVSAKGGGLPRVAICDATTGYCKEFKKGIDKPIDIKKPEIRTPPVNYFSQECIDKGFKVVSGFPFTYKCSEDKIGFYICYKSGKGIYIEPTKYLFSNLNSNSRNRLKNSICEQDSIPESVPVTGEGNVQDTSQKILDAEMIPSLFSKVDYINFNSSTGITFEFITSHKKNTIIPYHIINRTVELEKEKDTNIVVYLDEKEFNFNEEIYALVVPYEKYPEIISNTNNFIKTENSEFKNTQEYKQNVYVNMPSVYCYCTETFKSNSEKRHYMLKTYDEQIMGDLSLENKLKINQACNKTCVSDEESIIENSDRTFEYADDDYTIIKSLPFIVLRNYVLTQAQTIDKIKFLPNGNTFQFTIEKNNPHKKFVIVFMQKDNKRLNISYSNFYVLNHDEIKNYLLCEANRNVLSFFCNPYMDSRCKAIKSCFDEYDLNFNAIDLSELLYSKKSTGSQTIENIPEPVINPIVPITEGTEQVTTKYYSPKNNTGDNCSNAGITAGQWACVCTSYRGTKSVIAAKCTTNNGLVLYSSSTCSASTECNAARLLDNAKVNTCYTKSSTLCR